MSKNLCNKQHLNKNSSSRRSGFTIVELLIVVVVIAVLAAITIVAYNGINSRARNAALQSNLGQMTKALEVYKAQNNNAYPTSLAAGNIKTPDSGTYGYQSDGSTFCLFGTSGGVSYKSTNSVPNPVEGACSGVLANGDVCPAGFIVVPANSALGTNEFCVMKYEAKNVGGVATSQAGGTPWVSISQTAAASESTVACSGCHLITDTEWMAIAASVLATPSNWSGGSVGSGYIFSGHNDSSPNNALAASADDSDGYNNTGNTSGNQRRTLALSNGEVIWDLSGNVYEWTSQALTLNHIGIFGDADFTWRQWTNSSLSYGNLPATSRPSALASSPGLSGITGWSSTNGVGQLYANYAEATSRAIRRSGAWGDGAYAGVLELTLNYAPLSSGTTTGFRVAK